MSEVGLAKLGAAIRQALPWFKLPPALEGVDNPFKPWRQVT